MLRKAVRVLVLILVVFAMLFVVLLVRLMKEPVLIGEMLVNDCGEPKGGFEWVGLYNITIRRGVMELRFTSGLGDPLKTHKYICGVSRISQGRFIVLWILGGGHRFVVVNLTYYDVDPVWGLRNVYVAYYVDPTIFDGFRDHHYVELRILRVIERTIF